MQALNVLQRETRLSEWLYLFDIAAHVCPGISIVVVPLVAFVGVKRHLDFALRFILGTFNGFKLRNCRFRRCRWLAGGGFTTRSLRACMTRV